MERSSIVILIMIILLVLSVGGILGYLYYTGYFNKNSVSEQTEIPKISFYVSPMDYDTKNSTIFDFMLFQIEEIRNCLSKDLQKIYVENITQFYEIRNDLKTKNIDENFCYSESTIPRLIQQGTLYEGLNDFKIYENSTYYLYHFSEDYYVSKDVWLSHSMYEKKIWKTYSYKKANNISFIFQGEIQPNKENDIRIFVNSNNNLKHIILCFKWTFGIINVNGDYKETKVPLRTDADKCFKTGTNILTSDISKYYDFSVKTQNLIEEDLLVLTVVDEDELLNDIKTDWFYDIEDKYGKDIGAKDKEFIIKTTNFK